MPQINSKNITSSTHLFKVLIGTAQSLLFSFAMVGGSGAAIAQTDFPSDDATFCADAQALIAQTEARATNVLHENYDAFVESKAKPFPLETQQFYSSPAAEDAQLNTVVSCKMRTAGSIADAYSDAGEPVTVGEDQSCHFLTTHMLEKVRDSIPHSDAGLTDQSIVVEEEELTFMGPMWLDPWPFQSAYRDESGGIHLKSRALYVPWSVFIPAPAAFKGVYYCHLPTPAYLKALLLGEVDAPLENQ
jgi:hypothetical protein